MEAAVAMPRMQLLGKTYSTGPCTKDVKCLLSPGIKHDAPSLLFWPLSSLPATVASNQFFDTIPPKFTSKIRPLEYMEGIIKPEL